MAPWARDAELQRGTVFGRYVVLDWLGAGGMGVVYSAFDPDLNRGVALKVLRNGGADLADRLPIRDLLLREAQAMAQLAHPNVVTVFDVGSVDDRVFIAMELVEGQTLAAWLRAQPRKRGEIVAVFLAAGHGLAAAHAAGLIHRDFKPDNVLVGNDGRVRVTDFGLARGAPPDAATCAAGPPTGQLQTAVAGTLAYMAPEQYLGRSVDARADQFSFAVALHEALCGERPFISPLAATTAAVPPTPPGARIPVAVRRVLVRALSPASDDRYASMTELLAALAPKPRRYRRLAIAAIVVGAAAVAFAAAFAIHLQRVAERRVDRLSRLRGLAAELRAILRNDQMAPLHDIRPERDRVRATMRDLERELQSSAGRKDRAVIELVLGEGHRALGDHQRAVVALEAAWAAGERGPQLDAVLGDTLGAVYWDHLQQIDSEVPAVEQAAQTRDIERRYRDPAMRHLRAALAAGASSPAYLEALIAFHERRFDDASRGASAVFEESHTFYEAGILDARAHHEAGRSQLAANRREEARQAFAVARQIFERAVDTARSDDDAWLRYGEMVYVQAHDLSNGDLPPDLRARAIDAFHRARAINPDRWEAILSEAAIYEYEANLAILSYQDPRPHIDRVLVMANEARAHGAPADRVDTTICRAYRDRAVYETTHGAALAPPSPRPSPPASVPAGAHATRKEPRSLEAL